MRYKLILFLIMALFALSYGDEYRNLMGQGQNQYKKADYKESAENFKQAEVLKPDDPIATFNNGAAIYKSQDYKKATEKFSQAASKAKEGIKADSYYDLGNACFKNKDFAGAMNAYKTALTLDSKNTNAKFNYELAKIRQQQQQKQDQKQNDQKKDQNKKQQDKNQDQQKQDQDKQQQNQNQDQQKQNKDQQDKQQQDQQKQQQDKDKKQQQTAEAKPGEMSKQEAKELLGAFKEDEKQVQQQLRKVKVRAGSGRDW